jgi:hypothetical protein
MILVSLPISEMGLLEVELTNVLAVNFFGGIISLKGEDPNCQMKMMLTGAKYIEIQNSQVPYPRGIKIDVISNNFYAKGKSCGKKSGRNVVFFLLHTISVEIELRYTLEPFLK